MKLALTEKDNNIHVVGELTARKRDEPYVTLTTAMVLDWIKENHSYKINKTVNIPSTKYLHNSLGISSLKGEWVFSLKTLENKKEINDTTIVEKIQLKKTTPKRKKRSRNN